VDFHGSLDELHLPDIIQFLSGAGKTGVLRLVSDRQEGDIYIQNGRVTHAASADIVGEEAVYTLLLLNEGKFDFEPDVAIETSTISKSSTSLLMEAARRKDEWENVISKQIPDVEGIPEFLIPEQSDTGKQITLNTSEWVVLSKIDGERTIKAIAKDARISLYQTCRLLYSLVSTGLLRIRVQEPNPDPSVEFPE
jgi:hypothetical protein